MKFERTTARPCTQSNITNSDTWCRLRIFVVLTVLLQNEVAEFASRRNVLLGTGGAEYDAADCLSNDVGALRIQRANRRLRVRVSRRNDKVVARTCACNEFNRLLSLRYHSPSINKHFFLKYIHTLPSLSYIFLSIFFSLSPTLTIPTYPFLLLSCMWQLTIRSGVAPPPKLFGCVVGLEFGHFVKWQQRTYRLIIRNVNSLGGL